MAVHRSPVQRRPQAHGFADLDALLKLRLLQLDADALQERDGVAKRIEAEHGDAPAVGDTQSLDALHRRRLAGAVRADEAEDLALEDLEGDILHRADRAVGFREAGGLDDTRPR